MAEIIKVDGLTKSDGSKRGIIDLSFRVDERGVFDAPVARDHPQAAPEFPSLPRPG